MADVNSTKYWAERRGLTVQVSNFWGLNSSTRKSMKYYVVSLAKFTIQRSLYNAFEFVHDGMIKDQFVETKH